MKPPQWAVNVLPMMQALLNLINILFQGTRRPKFHHPSPSHSLILTPFLLILRTLMAHQTHHYKLILLIFLHYSGLYGQTTYLKSLPHVRTSIQGFTLTENTRTKVGRLSLAQLNPSNNLWPELDQSINYIY